MTKRASRKPKRTSRRARPNGYGRGYAADPKWMSARFDSVDDEGNRVRKGDEILYWPSTKRVQTGEKAKAAWQRFLSEKGDEEGTPYARNPRRNSSFPGTVAGYREAHDWLVSHGFRPVPGSSRYTDGARTGRIVDAGRTYRVEIEDRVYGNPRRTANGARMFAWSNPGMDAAQFCEAVRSAADLNGKTLWCQHESRLAGERHDTVYMNFINLTPERVKEKRGGGAESENNRVHLKVDGFARQLGEPPPTGKVKFETLSAYPHKPLRGKTAPPEAMVKYVADYISKLAQTPSNLTHANPRKRTSKKKRTSRRAR